MRCFSVQTKRLLFINTGLGRKAFLKLTGQGITVDLRGISKPVWQEDFTLKEVYAGCISADTECQVTYEHILPFDLLKFFS